MATVTRENIGVLHDKLTVKITANDYKPAFEASLKKQAANANVPGFRKGMVPVGVLKKMYGNKAMYDEVLKKVEKELDNYLKNEKIDILFQPLALGSTVEKIDLNNPTDYEFSFEIGIKPDVKIDASSIKVTRYIITVTDEMITSEVERVQSEYGTITDLEIITSEEDRLNIILDEADANSEKKEGGIEKATNIVVKFFTPEAQKKLFGLPVNSVVDIHLATDFGDKERAAVLEDLGIDKGEAGSADKTFKMTITKIGILVKAPLDENLFKLVYPSKEITTEEEFKASVKENIATYFKQQSDSQIHDQIYHYLVEHTLLELPKEFLIRIMQVNSEKKISHDEARTQYDSFASQFKWTLISNQLQKDENVKVLNEDLINAAKAQLMQYLGGQMQMFGNDTSFIDQYAERMLKDKKFVDENYHNILVNKILSALEPKVSATEETIDFETFNTKLHHHHY